LLQFANFERYFDKTSEQHYTDAASEPKMVLWYDTGHELNDPQALRDPVRMAGAADWTESGSPTMSVLP
jgi:hypothetical protein